MSTTLEKICVLVQRGVVRISDHGYDELIADGILAREAIQDIAEAVLVEDYPNYPKGPCTLVREQTMKIDTSMCSGAFQKGRQARRCSLPPTGQTRNCGKMIF